MPDSQYSVITARGADAHTFLQGQLSNDLDLLPEEEPLLTAWCNPKGRVICLMRVTRIDGGYGLLVPDDLADELVRRLLTFRFRAKVEFETQAANAGQLGLGGSVEDRLLANLRAGIPEVRQAQSEKFTPHMLNLDLLGAINFEKGCYTGQEVVARTHYRGATKRRTLRFRSAEPVATGDKVTNGDRDIGEVLNAIGTDLLAVIPTDKADEALTVNGVPIEHMPLPYM
jgi:folate-binding protein YgfZ